MNRPAVGGILKHIINAHKMGLDGWDEHLLFQENYDDNPEGIELLEEENIPYSIIPGLDKKRPLWSMWKMYFWLLKFLRTEKPDILETHTPIPGFIGRLAAIRTGVPVTVHIFHGHFFHSYFSRPLTFAIRKLEAYLAKRTTRVVTISEKLKHELSHIYKIAPQKDITVLPINIDLSEFIKENSEVRDLKREMGFEEDDIILITIGRIVPIKNQALFLRLIAQLRSENKKVKGILVGNGEILQDLYSLSDEIKLDKAINEINGQKAISFAGERRDIADLLQMSDAFVLTSFNEGTPLVLLEAQTTGIPVLSTDVGGVSEIVSPETSRLSPSDNLEELTKNTKELLSQDLSEALERRKQEVINRYDLAPKKIKMQKFYEDLLLD